MWLIRDCEIHEYPEFYLKNQQENIKLLRRICDVGLKKYPNIRESIGVENHFSSVIKFHIFIHLNLIPSLPSTLENLEV